VRQKNLTIFNMKYHDEVSHFYVKVVFVGKLSKRHFKKYVIHLSPTIISQALRQSYSKIFHHPTSHVLRDLRDSFLYALV
jgi:hypothetical protein